MTTAGSDLIPAKTFVVQGQRIFKLCRMAYDIKKNREFDAKETEREFGIVSRRDFRGCPEKELSTAFGFIAYTRDDEVIISFAGSTTKFDWLHNFLSLSYLKYRGISVAAGFQKYYENIGEKIEQEFKAIRHPKKIVICGHSLGGALASIAAVMFKTWLRVRCPVELYTFGAPRVFTSVSADVINQIFNGKGLDFAWRFVNKGDVVPKVPSVGKKATTFNDAKGVHEAEYKHFGTPILLTDKRAEIISKQNFPRLFFSDDYVSYLSETIRNGGPHVTYSQTMQNLKHAMQESPSRYLAAARKDMEQEMVAKQYWKIGITAARFLVGMAQAYFNSNEEKRTQF